MLLQYWRNIAKTLSGNIASIVDFFCKLVSCNNAGSSGNTEHIARKGYGNIAGTKSQQSIHCLAEHYYLVLQWGTLFHFLLLRKFLRETGQKPGIYYLYFFGVFFLRQIPVFSENFFAFISEKFRPFLQEKLRCFLQNCEKNRKTNFAIQSPSLQRWGLSPVVYDVKLNLLL